MNNSKDHRLSLGTIMTWQRALRDKRYWYSRILEGLVDFAIAFFICSALLSMAFAAIRAIF